MVCYKHCKQKHAITEDFDTDEEFVTEDKDIVPETSSLGTGKADKRVKTVDTDKGEFNPTSVSAFSDVSLREEISPYLDEFSPLCHVGDAPFLIVVKGD